MKKYHWLFLAAFIFIAGCIPSIYPLYTDETLTFEEKLLGEWTEEEDYSISEETGEKIYSTWNFKKAKRGNYYDLIRLTKDGERSEYEVNLVKLGKQYYFDFYPADQQKALSDLDEFLFLHLFPVHTFAKAELEEEKVVFYMFDADWMAKLIGQRKIRIRHEEVDDMILLSASTEELQKFVLKYGGDPKAYIDPVTLVKNG